MTYSNNGTKRATRFLFTPFVLTVLSTPFVFAAEAPAIRLVVLPLRGESIQQCELSSVRALRSHGFKTEVLNQGPSVVKIWGTKDSKCYAIQLECDKGLNTKAVAFSHPFSHNSKKVESIIYSLLKQ